MRGSAAALALVLTAALGSSPAAARFQIRYKAAHKEPEHASKEPFGQIPKGPLQIVVSLNEQRLHLYSDGIPVAETAVATGVPQLPTPTGVFSVIQKDRFHHSNIYSNAPMPFMQRITWSGVALHEGENIGHPASHGCIRMPHDFAVKLWLLTKLGARVIVAKPDLKPVEFADVHLFVHKAMPVMPPVPMAAAPDAVKTAQVSDGNRTSDAAAAKPATPAAADPKDPPVVSPSAAAGAPQPDPAPAAATASASDEAKTTPAAAGAPASNDSGAAAKIDPPAQNDTAAAPAPATAPQDDSAKATAGQIGHDELKGALADAAPSAPLDGAVPLPPDKPAALLDAIAAAHAPIAVFISRKTKKIYVRQHFTPLFDAPIEIAQPEQPFGTHVFTALNYLDDGSTFRWNVVSFPADAPKRIAERQVRVERYVHGRRREEMVERPVAPPQPPQTPAEVLARIDIPQDVIDRISDMMVPGSSLVVSDQGLGEETGAGTDFIVVTH